MVAAPQPRRLFCALSERIVLTSTQAIGPVPADLGLSPDVVVTEAVTAGGGMTPGGMDTDGGVDTDGGLSSGGEEILAVPASWPDAPEPDDRPVAPAPRSSHPKKSVEFAWATWQATSTSSGSEFLQSVSSWTEGTAAQLLRRRWTVGFKPPTSAQIQERLRHNLALAARGSPSTHMEALGRARDSVIEELRRAQLPARTPHPKPSIPRGR